MFSKSILFTKISDCVVGLCLFFPKGHKQFMEEGVATEGGGVGESIMHTQMLHPWSLEIKVMIL